MHPADQEVLSDERKAVVMLELARILEHPSFRGSRRCCRFLEYSVQQVLKGSTQDGLKERTIGVEALQRPPDYDTSEDAIVRVTANEVRKRLAQYYQNAGGSAGALMISLPLGSYAVAIQWPTPLIEPAPSRAERPRKPPMAVGILAGICVLLIGVAAVAVYISSRNPSLSPKARSAAVATNTAGLDPFWSRIFNPGHKTSIVLSDAVYREIQYFAGRDFSLSEYLAPGYPDSLLSSARPELRSVAAFVGRQQTTSIGSAGLAARLMTFGSRMGGDPVVRYPRHINAREFQTDNFVLLGSRLSIPWVEMFEPSLNFPLTTDKVTHHFYLRNRVPKAGEQTEYRESANQEETYADIAVLPNLSGTGTVLILNGIDMVAAETAGEFAMNGALTAALAQMHRAGGAGSGKLYAEILIRVRALAGTAASTQVVATRQVAGPMPETPSISH
jgi:hypothetical protein